MTIKVKGFVTHCLGNFYHCCLCFVPNTCSSGSLREIRAPVKSTSLIVNIPQGKPCKYCIGTSKLPAWFASSGPKGLRFFLNLYIIAGYKNIPRAQTKDSCQQICREMQHGTTWKKIASFTSEGFIPAKLQLKYILHK